VGVMTNQNKRRRVNWNGLQCKVKEPDYSFVFSSDLEDWISSRVRRRNYGRKTDMKKDLK
jgi:hypothetical protein